MKKLLILLLLTTPLKSMQRSQSAPPPNSPSLTMPVLPVEEMDDLLCYELYDECDQCFQKDLIIKSLTDKIDHLQKIIQKSSDRSITSITDSFKF